VKREWPAVDNSYHRPVYYSRQQAAFRVGQRAARSIPERWPAEPLAGIHLLRFKAIDSRQRSSLRVAPLHENIPGPQRGEIARL
jgi:hypothetical protein